MNPFGDSEYPIPVTSLSLARGFPQITESGPFDLVVHNHCGERSIVRQTSLLGKAASQGDGWAPNKSSTQCAWQQW